MAATICRRWIKIFEVADGPESDPRLMLPLGECGRLLQSAVRTSEAAEVGAKYDVHF